MIGPIRQGDVLLFPVERDAPNVPAMKRVVLAEGEITGHAHVLEAPAVFDWTVGEDRYVRVEGDMGSLTHEDHDPTPVKVIEPGVTYKVIPQREWNLEGQWQKVRD